MTEKLNALVWSDAMLLLLLGSGLYFTLRIRGFQVRGWRTILRRTVLSLRRTGNGDRHSLTQLQTLSTTLAATMGTGNIVGVATALTLGGAGAVFWMWISALLGMALVYAENVLGMRYRYRNRDGSWCGGPIAYLERGLHCKPLALTFAGFCVLASFGMGNMAQVNSMAGALQEAWRVPPWAVGLAATALCAGILWGGIRRIGRVAECLIPPLSLCYLLGCCILLALRYAEILPAFRAIFTGAFGLSAVGGGVAGAAVRRCANIGLRRGIFSNEAGLGSSSMLHAAAEQPDPSLQGMWGMFEVFADTIVCCTMTALVLLTAAPSALDGAPLVMEAFAQGFGSAGTVFITAAVVLFAFATLIGWSCCGEAAVRYLSPHWGRPVYRLFFLAACFVGATTELRTVWNLCDVCNGLMAIPNLIGMLALRRQITSPQTGAA